MRKYGLFFIIYISLIFLPVEEFSLRRIKSSSIFHDNISISTSDGSAIPYFWKYFPDGEIYIRLQNPGAVKGQDIKLQFQAEDKEDFLRLLFLVSAIREYNPDSIEVKFQNWAPQNVNEEAILSALAHFTDSIKLPQKAEFSSYTRGVIPAVSKFDTVLYLKERFQNYAHKLGDEFNAEVSRITVSQHNLHWDLQIPQGIRNKDILLIHSTQSSDDILNLISTLYALKKAGARSITLLNTYQGYARQDKIFNPGEGLTGYALLKVLNALCDYNLAINVHFGDKSGEAGLREESVYNINGFRYLAQGVFDHILTDYSSRELNGKELVLLAPDDGSFNYVQEAVDDVKRYLRAKGIEMDVVTGYLNKTRLSSERVVMENGILGEDGSELNIPKDAFFIILDDETSTGMTVKVATYHLVNNLGFNWWHIYAGVVHGKFIKEAKAFFVEGEDNIPPRFIASLDTLDVPEKIARVSIYPLLVRSIKKFLSLNPVSVPH